MGHVPNFITEITEDNVAHYFSDQRADAFDRKGAGLRYAKWIDLRYRLWRLCDDDFGQALAAIEGILERYDQTRGEEAQRQDQKDRIQPSQRAQKQLMSREPTKGG